jgi:hypothetical protein
MAGSLSNLPAVASQWPHAARRHISDFDHVEALDRISMAGLSQPHRLGDRRGG